MAKREISEERRQQLREQLARAREAKKAQPKAERIAQAVRENPGLIAPNALTSAGEAPPRKSLSPERRAKMLQDIDPEIGALISDEELLKIEAEERAVAEAERKSKALERVRGEIRQKARVENDLISADVLRSDAEKRWLAEEVTFKITLPDSGAGRGEEAGFRVNGFLYQIGRTYTRPRHVFQSLHSNHYGAWLKEIAFRTLDQHKPGQDARFIVGNRIPQFEVVG